MSKSRERTSERRTTPDFEAINDALRGLMVGLRPGGHPAED